ncbi:hypothetical protein N9L66_00420 [Porticoccaceae bacterium]|nr:hypothetical protein [Porticoccaceae bacterium]MDA8663410.1 hypothetical protein [Porticoccaceae bacterium]MDA8682048.1 hypothetical protein [Porticoccaceae bacterium]MDA8788783.1 hypothetical protein [Porticoccaceae bacterium]MDB2343065.1 hypothetical protein [Porticoccaceae bacterium]
MLLTEYAVGDDRDNVIVLTGVLLDHLGADLFLDKTSERGSPNRASLILVLKEENVEYEAFLLDDIPTGLKKLAESGSAIVLEDIETKHSVELIPTQVPSWC